MKQFSTKFLIGVILVVGFFVYATALPNGFVWDDEEQIVNNTVVRDWSNLPLFFTSSTFYAGGAGLSGGFYRPLVSISYLINYKIWGLNPLGFRFFHLIFHLLNLLLIFFILRKILASQQIKYSNEISALATILFAVHPANVEAVAYLGSIGEILYSFFGLLAIWMFLKGINYENRQNLIVREQFSHYSARTVLDIFNKNKHLILSFFLIFLGLLAKETAVVFFLLIALYFFIFTKPKFQFWLKYTLGTAISLGAYLFLRFFVAKIPAISTHFAPISTASFLERLQTIPYEIFSYLRIIFFPKDLAISQHFVAFSVNDIRFWGSLIFLFIILLLVIFYLRKIIKTPNLKYSTFGTIVPNVLYRWKIPIFFLLWFFGGLSPALNIFPLDMTVAERWLYFPMIGILALVSLLIIQLIKNFPKIWRQTSYIFLILIILTLSAQTVVRATDWKNGLTLFSHDIRYSKNSFDLENNYGVELFRAGKIDEAGLHFKKSIELQPKWTYPHNNLGAVLERKGDLQGALAEYKKSAELSDYYLAYENIGGILFKMRKYEEAKDFLLNALQKFPRNANLKWQLALVYLTENDTQKATSLLLMALEDDPQNLKVRQLLEAIQRGVKIELQ